jgi:hypothetical protein
MSSILRAFFNCVKPRYVKNLNDCRDVTTRDSVLIKNSKR